MGIRGFYGVCRAFVNSLIIRALNLSKSDGFVCRAFVNSSRIRALNSSKEVGTVVFVFDDTFVFDDAFDDAFGALKNASDKIDSVDKLASKSNLK